MKLRYALQIVALLLVIAIIATLGFALAGKIDYGAFWIVAIIAIVVAYLLHGPMKQ